MAIDLPYEARREARLAMCDARVVNRRVAALGRIRRHGRLQLGQGSLT